MPKQVAQAAAVFAAAFVSVLATAGAGADDQPAEVEHGRDIYAQKCSHCHGPNMVNPGTVVPDLRAFPDDRTRFVTTVKQGKNNRMPPWGDILSDEEIAELWSFISSRRKP